MFWTIFWPCFVALWLQLGLAAAWFTWLHIRDISRENSKDAERRFPRPTRAVIHAFLWGPFGLGTILRNMTVA